MMCEILPGRFIMGEEKQKSKQLVRLFTAALMTFPLTGCGDNLDLCYDQNHDGLCDDDGSRYNPNSYVVINGKREAFLKPDSDYVSSGSSSGGYKSGIGKKSGGLFGG
jgi:hypothetical protein